MPATRTCECMSCAKCHQREHARKVYRLRAQGQWNPRGDLTSVTAHLAYLKQNRVGLKAIHERTGISISTLTRIRSGGNTWVSKPVAEAILGITVTDGGLLPAAGTRRRIRALGRIGWSTYYIAERIGVTQNAIWELANRRMYVKRDTFERISALYDELCMTVGPSTVSICRAVEKGWEPPLAWDDIDNPWEDPAHATAAHANRRAQVVEDYDFLISTGLPVHLAAERVGVSIATVADYRRHLVRAAS